MKITLTLVFALISYSRSFAQHVLGYERYNYSNYNSFGTDVVELKNGNLIVVGNNKTGVLINTTNNAKQNWAKLEPRGIIR